jgi:divalent metal cation (Fe/Co/Zn/Cd) transporter
MRSSTVVLAGLGVLYLAKALPETSVLRPLLERADAFAALGISLIILHISWNLGKRATNVLLDAGDIALAAKIREALRTLPCIHSVHGIRTRRSGPDFFVDLELCVDTGLTLDEGEQIKAKVEASVCSVVEHATVNVVLAPRGVAETDRISRLKGLAAAHGLVTHAVKIFDLVEERGHDHMLVEMHVELPPSMPLCEAHAKVTEFERAFLATRRDVIIVTHIEPQGEGGKARVMRLMDSTRIKNAVVKAAMEEPGVKEPHNMLVRTFDKDRYVSFHCRMAPETSVEAAHEAAGRIQKTLHKELPELEQIFVHMEPFREET